MIMIILILLTKIKNNHKLYWLCKMSNLTFLNLGVFLLNSNSIRSAVCELDVLEMANEFFKMNLSITQYSPV